MKDIKALFYDFNSCSHGALEKVSSYHEMDHYWIDFFLLCYTLRGCFFHVHNFKGGHWVGRKADGNRRNYVANPAQ